MALLDLVSASLPLATGLSITATGATSLVAAPGAGRQIAVQTMRVYLMTTTTGQVETAFLDGTTTATPMFNAIGISLGAATLDRDMQASPWFLATNSALLFRCSVSAASTPTARVEVIYQIVQKG